jgi:hypothetical protein
MIMTTCITLRTGRNFVKIYWLTVLLLAFFSVASPKDCKADLVFSIVQSAPANNASLAQGESNAGTFDILIRSTVENQSFLGADFTLTLSRLDGRGGLFASGVNVLMPNSSNPEGFIRGTFDNGPLGQVLYSTIANQPLTLGSSDTVLARVVMTTLGAEIGNYSMSLSELAAIDNGFNGISSTSSGSLPYSITAVPEPSSMLLTAIGVGSVAWRSRRKLLNARS